jgi:hypothetical protein
MTQFSIFVARTFRPASVPSMASFSVIWAAGTSAASSSSPYSHSGALLTPEAFAQRMATKPPRIHTANSLDDCLKQWYDGQPENGLFLPLADWPTSFRKSGKSGTADSSTATLFGHRLSIAMAWEAHGQSLDSFRAQYLETRVKKLVNKIRGDGQAQGTRKVRIGARGPRATSGRAASS